MRVEHVDDLALIAHQLDKLNIVDLFNEQLPDHGNWRGLSGGSVVYGWLLYILSQADHRLSHVQDWADQHLHVLQVLLGQPTLRALDFNDDRLGRLLDRCSEDVAWTGLEMSLAKSFVEVYDLSTHGELVDDLTIVRTDSFNAPQFREPGELFRHGFTKHRRADQVQCKVMMSMLDSAALPLATEIVSGNGGDYKHYLPVIEKVQRILPGQGHLYVGDSHMSSTSNREAIHKAGHYYLSPLNAKQCHPDLLLKYLDELPVGVEQLPSISSHNADDPPLAYFHELPHEMQGENIRWTERRVLCYSIDYAQKLSKSFDKRLDQAQHAIEQLVVNKRGRRLAKSMTDLQVRIAGLIKRHAVQDCFTISTSQVDDVYTIQRHKNRPARMGRQTTFHISIKRNDNIITIKRQRIGWQIYATNAPLKRITGGELIRQYRREYRIEHLFDYFINRDCALLPLYLKKEHRVKGLIRLLVLVMQVSSSIQGTVRRQLERSNELLGEVYPGNPGRKTQQPTTPMLLQAFRGISVVFMKMGSNTEVQMTPLKMKQERILTLARSDDAYQRLVDLLEVQFNMRET